VATAAVDARTGVTDATIEADIATIEVDIARGRTNFLASFDNNRRFWCLCSTM
jgi:hypothetical protein